ncbi:unnamed protein product [Pieris brassicae]|uniref:SUI1 domain-containing protein n=1 Tax=Pieris brassicae TaxID=7116 RepID=A0A9P0TPH7_PIEBR|nr:unnamed protein product [Pieris brassicae]
MFAKPYKLKSTNTLKNSEKKHLIQRLEKGFPSVNEEKLKEIVPNKSTCNFMKLVLHSGETTGVYAVDGVPMIIDTGETLVPTVCALWKVPDLIPTIVIHSPVLSKVQGGVPLYAPGVVTDPTSFPRFNKGSLLAVCTDNNAAAAIVGRAMMSSGNLLIASMGTCLEVLHVIGDNLCKELKFNKIERPKLQHGLNVNSVIQDMDQLNLQVKEEWPSLVPETPVVNEPRLIPDNVTDNKIIEEIQNFEDTIAECSDTEESIPSDMDGLLRWCLLSFLKIHGKDVELPLKTNLLYKNYLMSLCPPDRSIDVKKSSFKKMGKFLEAMQREGLVEVKEIEKGVDALVSVQISHPAVRSHTAVKPTVSAPVLEYQPPVVRELYCITAHVLELFLPLKKGTPLPANEVRRTVREYVKSKQLDAGRGSVKIDATLAKATGIKEQTLTKWDELMAGLLSHMTASTELVFADGTSRLIKTRIDPIQMQVFTRSGNKKVTLVSNLEAFGFVLPTLAQECQRAVAASCGVTRSAGASHDQLMLQGDQTHFMAKLLIEKYGLPKKYLDGADKALNKKK